MTEHNLAPTNQFANLTEEEFRIAFLAAARGTNEDANRFFNQFKYKYDLFARNFSAALSQGVDLLARCYAVDKASFCQIHKGSAYYWLGIAAFFVRDYELATFFFDASVAEDLRAGADPINNPTPSLHFMLIEGDPPNQAARDLVQFVQAKTEELIGSYASCERLTKNPPMW